jgi:hypothetical protein
VHRRPGGPKGQSGWVGKISPPPGFNPLTVQPIASCYTVYATPVDIYSIQVYSILYSNQPAKPVTLDMSSITQLIFNIILLLISTFYIGTNTTIKYNII